MKVHHILTGKSISEKAVAHAIELSETKYCSVAATLRPGVEIQSSFEIIEETAHNPGVIKGSVKERRCLFYLLTCAVTCAADRPVSHRETVGQRDYACFSPSQ